MDDDANESCSSVCLRTPLILGQIMKHFSNKELLTSLSFVNKLWNYEARRILSYRGRLIAMLFNCQDLEAFATDMRQMNLNLFSGVGISINSCRHLATCQPLPTGALDPTYHELCHQFPWKCLYLNVCGNWELSKNCPAFLFITRALRDFSGIIERMSIRLDYPQAGFSQKFIEDLEFPSLQKLTISGRTDPKFYKALFSRAPNLEEIYPSDGIWGMNGDLLEGSSAVVCVRTIRTLHLDLCEGILSALRFKRVELYAFPDDAIIVEKFHRVIPKVLQTSRFVLKSMMINSVFLVQFMRYGICFEKLSTLEIYTSREALGLFQLQILNLLKRFDFTRIFPLLSSVSLNNTIESSNLSPAQISDFIGGCATSQEPKPDRAVNIKILSLNENLKEYEIPFLSAVFPDIETLAMVTVEGPKVRYEQIWRHWIHLKELIVYNDSAERWLYEMQVVNFDSAFCGIFPEEVAELREKDDDYLKAVHIVPVAPSITCVREIMTVELLLGGKDDEPAEELFAEIDLLSAFVFSKVTGLIAFAKCPNLSVTLKTNSYRVERELSHMKRYAQVILDRTQFGSSGRIGTPRSGRT